MWLKRTEWRKSQEELKHTKELVEQLIISKNKLSNQLDSMKETLDYLQSNIRDPRQYEWEREQFESIHTAIRNVPKIITVRNVLDIK